MAAARQKPISITSRDRDILDSYKRRYDESTGERTDWGTFLGTVALLGLAAAGVYHLVNAKNRSPQSVDIECFECGEIFIMAVPQGVDRAVYTSCPACDAELVVDLGTLY